MGVPLAAERFFDGLPPAATESATATKTDTNARAFITVPSSHVVAAEELAHRAVFEHGVDRLREKGRDREHAQVVEALLVGDRYRVRDDDLANRSILQAIDRRTRKQAVCRRDVHLDRAAIDEQVGRADQG